VGDSGFGEKRLRRKRVATPLCKEGDAATATPGGKEGKKSPRWGKRGKGVKSRMEWPEGEDSRLSSLEKRVVLPPPRKGKMVIATVVPGKAGQTHAKYEKDRIPRCL